MWKAILVAVAALLSTAQGWDGYRTYGSRTGVESWDQLLAELMQNSPITGVCGPLCYVTVNGENRILEQNSEPVTFSTDPCIQYFCTSSGVTTNTIQCLDDSKIQCPRGTQLIFYPESCCKQCEGQNKPPGEWTEWGEWTECSVSCGGGRRSRRRICTVQEDDTHSDCTGSLLEGGDCNTDACPIPCRWEYGEYGVCSATCGLGVESRYPIILQHEENGGEPCPPFVERGVPDTRECKIADCPTPCEWEYGPFEECSVSCGGGVRFQYPIITKQATNGGFCPPHVLEGVPLEDDCNHQACPAPCVWIYGPFGECSVTCGGGIKRSFPEVVTPAMNGGSCNLPEPKEMTCNTQSCPVDCRWRWGEYGPCSVTCEEGVRTRYPEIISPAMHGGICNLPQPQTETCTLDTPCMICEVGEHACPNRKGVYRCILDMDKDCITDTLDNCIDVYNPKQEDQEFDGVGDRCDNCPKFPNPLQGNADGDISGDACDADDDNDGILDPDDNCIFDANSDQIDSDGDGMGNVCDNCVSRKNKSQRDDDNDGIGNSCDNCKDVYNPNQLDSDCTVKSMAFDEDDNVITESDKNSLAAQIMEKLLEMYYSN